MMKWGVDAVTCLMALLLFTVGIRWLVDPAGVAANLGIALLDGTGLAMQIGDFASFFIGTALLLVVGVVRRNPALITAGALMVGVVAVFRLIAWNFHGAALTPISIGVEVVTLTTGLASAALARAAIAGEE